MFKVLFLYATVLVAAFAAPASDDDNWRVVGGSNADTGEFPYQVSLMTLSYSHFCGGSMINSRTIVTAAHCVIYREAAEIRVVVGTNYLNIGGQLYPVNRITTHPSYSSITTANDVAVVITASAITAGPGIGPIALSTETTGAGVSVRLSGWGANGDPGLVLNILQKITLSTISDDDCKSRLSSIKPTFDTQVCTLTKAGEGACKGDSGGPLVSGNSLVGIVSWGYSCAKGYPDVYTRVSSFASWINDNAQ